MHTRFRMLFTIVICVLSAVLAGCGKKDTINKKDAFRQLFYRRINNLFL